MPKKKEDASLDKLETKSPAAWFASNKNIAGFDNVRLCTRCAALERALSGSLCILWLTRI